MQEPMKKASDEDREHYFGLYKANGIDSAITELHNDIGVLEPKVFDNGYNKERFERVQSLRLLAQELWNIKLREQTTKVYGEDVAEKHFGKTFAKVK